MLKTKLIAGAALFAAMVFGMQTSFALDHNRKKHTSFKVRVENIGTGDGLTAEDGSKYPFAISPGLYTVSGEKVEFFKLARAASKSLEAQAEDGNPEVFWRDVLGMPKEGSFGVFNTPVGAGMPGPILPGGTYEFTFSATKGMKLNLIVMYGQSNDLFYAPESAIDLFVNGKPFSGDIADKFLLWDAGTEVNQAPGLGGDQGPRQKAPNTGADENGVVRLVNDGFKYPAVKDVMRITITAM